MALDATVTLLSARGSRTIPVAALYQNDGIHYLTRKADEILTAVELPRRDGWRSTYWKLRRRGSFDFPVLSVAAAIRQGRDGTVHDARIVLGAVTSQPVLAGDAAAALIGAPLTDDAIASAAGLAANRHGRWTTPTSRFTGASAWPRRSSPTRCAICAATTCGRRATGSRASCYSVPTSRRVAWLIGVAALASYVVVYAAPLADAPIRSDGYSYYVYLPAWLIHRDPTLQAVADDCCGGAFPEFTSIVRWPATRQWINPHPIGVAVLMLPSFGAAHALTRWSNLPRRWIFALLPARRRAERAGSARSQASYLLRRFLVRWFSDSVVAATLATIAFGTNLFHYGTFDSTFSHACFVRARRGPSRPDRPLVAAR